MQQELAALGAMKDQEEAAYHENEEQRRAELDAQISELVKQGILAGAMPIETGTERLPLGKSESLCWDSPGTRLKQRSRQGNVEWARDDDGTLFVTTERVVFATPDAKRWQRPRSKLHTVRVEYLGSQRDVPALVLGFDGLQKPVAFCFGKVTANTTVANYQCSVTLTVTDLANLLQQFGAS